MELREDPYPNVHLLLSNPVVKPCLQSCSSLPSQGDVVPPQYAVVLHGVSACPLLAVPGLRGYMQALFRLKLEGLKEVRCCSQR